MQRFVHDELIGHEHELDTVAEMPLPLYARFADTGLTNWWLPNEHGGLGFGLEESAQLRALFLPVLTTSLVTSSAATRWAQPPGATSEAVQT